MAGLTRKRHLGNPPPHHFGSRISDENRECCAASLDHRLRVGSAACPPEVASEWIPSTHFTAPRERPWTSLSWAAKPAIGTGSETAVAAAHTLARQLHRTHSSCLRPKRRHGLPHLRPAIRLIFRHGVGAAGAALRARSSRSACTPHDRSRSHRLLVPPYSTVYTDISESDRNRLAHQGVVAELCATMINGNGQIVSSPLSDRLIAINHTQLAAVPNVIAVAGGPSKHQAIAAALASGIINSLVTDTATARHLLRQRPTSNPMPSTLTHG
jgi:putative sugar-binding domain-containing protein